LDNIDTGSGPIRERVYEIICTNLEPAGSLLLQSLRQINAMKEMPLCEWILDNRIFKPSFTSICIPSFLSSFSLVNTPVWLWVLHQQFLNNDGALAPFRMLASVFLQQLRIALTAKCGHFVECFRRFDEDSATLKAARTDAGVTADKQVVTYKRLGYLQREAQVWSHSRQSRTAAEPIR
jgi:hypothetical protein